MRLKTRSKYAAQPTTVDGIRFHSKKEATRYGELKLLQKTGHIDELELQPRYELYVQFQGRYIMLGSYVGDFRYWDRAKHRSPIQVVEDVKGFRTPLYRWKKKHVEAQYGIQIREI